MNKERKNLLIGFAEESFDILKQAAIKIEALRQTTIFKEVGYKDNMNTLCRMFNSIKGGAGFLELDAINRIALEAEALFKLLVITKPPITSELLDLFKRLNVFLIDSISQILDTSEVQPYQTDARDLVAEIQQEMMVLTDAMDQKPFEVFKEKDDYLEVIEISRTEQADLSEQDRIKFYVEANEMLKRGVELFRCLEKDVSDRQLLDDVHNIFAKFTRFSADYGYQDLLHISHEIMEAVQKTRNENIKVDSGIFSLMDEITEFLISGLKYINRGELPYIRPKRGLISLIRESFDDMVVTVEEKYFYGSLLNLDYGTIKDKIYEASKAGLEITTDDTQLFTTESIISLNNIPSLTQQADRDDLAEATRESSVIYDRRDDVNRRCRFDRRWATDELLRNQTVHIDTNDIKNLQKSYGDLLSAITSFKTVLSTARNSSELLINFHDLTTYTLEHSQLIEKIAGTTLFSSLYRLKEDFLEVASKSEKLIDIRIEGKEFQYAREFDNTLLAAISHAVRNSILHGIESSLERKEACKSDVAIITIRSDILPDETKISISDDGRGVDIDAIYNLARKKGLVTKPENLFSDDDILAFLFTSEFSTLETSKRTEHSGNGLAIMQETLKHIEGKVSLINKQGGGFEVVIHLPKASLPEEYRIVNVRDVLIAIPSSYICVNLLDNIEDSSAAHADRELIKTIDMRDFFVVSKDKKTSSIETILIEVADRIIELIVVSVPLFIS